MEQNELSFSSLNYLEAVHRLHKQTGCVHSIDLANDLHVSKPSVTRAVKLLEEEGLIHKNACGEIILTGKGLTAAESLCTRCRALREFFDQTIGDSSGLSVQEVGRLSYSMSDKIMDAIQMYLEKANPIDRRMSGSFCG